MSYCKKLHALAQRRRVREALAIVAYLTVVVIAILLTFYSARATAGEGVDFEHPMGRSLGRTELQDLPNKDAKSRFSYTGYAMQGWVLSRPEGYNIAGESSKRSGSVLKTEIGVYTSYHLLKNMDLRGGVKYDPTGTFGRNLHATFALVDIYADSGDVGIRLGRVRNFFGFASDTRDNPAVRDLDFAPQAIYREAFRSISSAGEGVQIYATHTTESYGSFSTEITVAKPILRPQRELVEGFFGFPVPGHYQSSKSAALTSVTLGYKSPDYKWATHYTISDLDLKYQPGHNDPIVSAPEQMALQIHTVGVRRYFNGWDLTGEVMKVNLRGEMWNILRRTPSQQRLQPMGASIQARVLLDQNWTVFAGYNVWFNNIYDRRGEGLANVVGIPQHRFYSKTAVVGTKYQNDTWVWRAELHHVNGTATLAVTDNSSLPSTKGRYTFVSTSLTYKF